MPIDPKSAELLTEATARFDRAMDAVRSNRTSQMDDLKFRAGDQWDDNVKQERESDGRPVLTFNRLPQFVRQITGEVRLNTPTIKIRPAGGGADKEGAKVLEGLIRDIQIESFADAIYATAMDNAASCGEGHWQMVTRLVDDDLFDQEIRLERITNPFAVLWDPDSTEQTRADAKYCFVLDEMTEDEFKRRYPDRLVADFQHEEPDQGLTHWRSGDNVIVADYWVKEPMKRRIVMMADGAVHDLDSLVDEEGKKLEEEQIDNIRIQAVREREVDSFKVVHYQLSGVEVLEGPTVWRGKHIPVFTVYGEEVHVGRETITHGIVRFAKDPQRVYNYNRSAATESIALAPKSPFIGTVKQFGGDLMRFWKNANKKNLPYLPYNPDANAPPPQRQPAPEIQLAYAQEANLSAQDMHSTTGIYPPALGEPGEAPSSGVADFQRQRESDVGTFVYQKNLAIAMTQCGNALVDLVPRIYDSSRTVRIMNEDDSDEEVEINRVVALTDENGLQMVDPQTGEQKTTIMADLSVGNYSVRVITGPSFTTRRAESSAGMMDFVRTSPEASQVVIDLIAKAQDWPGAEEIAERLRKIAVARGFAQPQEGEDIGEPDPNTVAEAQKLQAEAQKTAAEAEKTQAQTEQIVAETDSTQLANIQQGLLLALGSGAVQEALKGALVGVLQEIAQPPQLDQPQQTIVQNPNGVT